MYSQTFHLINQVHVVVTSDSLLYFSIKTFPLGHLIIPRVHNKEESVQLQYTPSKRARLDPWLPWAGDDCNWSTLAQCAVSLITIVHVTAPTMASKSSSARRERREQFFVGTCEEEWKSHYVYFCQ